jgi:PAS domain S-box-containing protein
MMLTAMDVTGRKHMEKKLAESESFLLNIFDGIQDGICVLDPEMNIMRVNHAMEERYGANLTGKKCYAVFQGSSEACENCPIERAIQLGTTQREILHDIKGWSEVYAFPMIDGQGKVTGIIEHVRDYNDRKRAENALRESEEKFRTLIEDIQVMVWAVDENYVCTYINPICKDLLGLAPEELLGKSPFYLLSPEELGRVRGLVKPCLDAHKPFEVVEYYVERKDGKKVYFKMNAMPIFDQAGAFKGYRGVSREVIKDPN